jgi:Kef-type K+ transport system membrane component KefB
VLFFGAITSQFLFEAALGAFLAGVMLSEIRVEYKKELAKTIRDVGESLFFPIFFLTIGLAVNVWSVVLSHALLLFAIIYICTSIVGKYMGGYFGALVSKLRKDEARAIGAGLIPRGGIGLIIAHVGLALGRFTEAQFSAVVLMIFITTVVGVIFIYKTFNKLK